MPLPLYYFLSITAVNILMSWALYLPYRVAHLHFITVANMAISGYTAAYLVDEPARALRLGAPGGVRPGRAHRLLVSLFIGDAPTFAVVIVGFTFIYITRTVIENLQGGRRHHGDVRPAEHRRQPRTPTAGSIIGILCGAAAPRRVSSSTASTTRGWAGPPPPCSWTRTSPRPSASTSRGWACSLQTVSCTIAGGCGVLYGFIYKSFHLDFFTFHLVGIFMTVIFVGGYATLWGTVVLAPILYGVPLLFPSGIAGVADRDLRRGPDPRAGAEAGGVHHPPVRRYH